jgi:hypothetical protein
VAATAAGEGKAAEGLGSSGAVTTARWRWLPLALFSIYRWWLARVKRGVVVGPAEMGLVGLRFKVWALTVGLG